MNDASVTTGSETQTPSGNSGNSTRISERHSKEDKTESEQRDGNAERNESPLHVGLRERISHFTWAWYTMTMSTGGVAIVLHETPHQFTGLWTLGLIVFLFGLAMSILFSIAMLTRAVISRELWKLSFKHPPECFYVSSAFLTWATMIACAQLYGVPNTGPWLITTIRVLFWIYAGASLLNVTGQYVFMFDSESIKSVAMTPAWLLPNFSAMLTGTIAGVIAATQPPAQRLPILVAGCAFQGLGFLIGFIIVVAYFLQCIQKGMPPPDQRPSMFMPLGVGAYTIVALILQARAVPHDYGYFAGNPAAWPALEAVALFAGVFMWLFTFWLFGLAVVGNLLVVRKMGFTLTWWAIVFPNVGFTLATNEIGKELKSPKIELVATVMTVGVVLAWLMDLWLNVKAVVEKRILWPGKDEDKDVMSNKNRR